MEHAHATRRPKGAEVDDAAGARVADKLRVAEPDRVPAWALAAVPIGAATDRRELDADAVAAAAVGSPPAAAVGGGAPESPHDEPSTPATTHSVRAALESAAMPLHGGVRAQVQPLVATDLSSVKVHTGTAAGASARALGVPAYTVGDHIVFAPGQYRPGDVAGQRVIAHELAHVSQQLEGHAPLSVQRHPRRSRQPFVALLESGAAATDALSQLTADVGSVAPMSADLTTALVRLRDLQASTSRMTIGLNTLVDVYEAGDDVETSALVRVDPLDYVLRGAPNRDGIARRERQFRAIAATAQLVRMRVVGIKAQLGGLGPHPLEHVRDAFQQLISFYLELVGPPGAVSSGERLGFLDTFFANAEVVVAYGTITHVNAVLPDLYLSVRNVSDAMRLPLTMPAGAQESDVGATRRRYESTPGYDHFETQRMLGAMIVHNRLIRLRNATSRVAPMPRSLADLATGMLPTRPGLAADLAGEIFQAQVEIAVLAVWQPIQSLYSLIYSHNAIGVSLDPRLSNENQLRNVWLRELRSLEVEFAAELGQRGHPNIQQRLDGWERRVRHLINVVPPEARRTHIISAIVTQIPFLFVAGATVVGVGVWVARITQGSRILIALAEGATMTALTALAVPPGAPGRPTTPLGWGVRLAENVAFAGLARVLFQTFNLVGNMATGRLALLRMPIAIGPPVVVIATLQTTAQVIEARATGAGGDTTFTELLTINLVLGSIGVLTAMAAAA